MIIDAPSKVTTEVAEKIIALQPRCMNPACGSTYALHIHHRIFRSEGEQGLDLFLSMVKQEYENSYGRIFGQWHMHEIQNLVRLCQDCHEGDQGRGVHGGNTELRLYFRNSFTCPVTGFNVPFRKLKTLF